MKTLISTYYDRNKEVCKEKALDYYYEKTKISSWRLKENKRLRVYYTLLLKNPLERLKYNIYMRDYMRIYQNIPEMNWRIR